MYVFFLFSFEIDYPLITNQRYDFTVYSISQHKGDNIEFAIVLKNNKLLSFNLNSNEEINDFIINAGKVEENTWSMYLRTNVKPLKYPNFDKYEEKDIYSFLK